jgi:hypothetical protein
MTAPGVAASGTGTGTPQAGGGSGGSNPFWEVTNLFSQKNKLGVIPAYLMTAAAVNGGAQINFGNYFRGLRLQVRTTVQPVGAFTAPPNNDLGFQLIQAMGIQNTDGAEILFDVINGFAYYQRNKYMRPWLKDWASAYDYVAPSSTPSGPAFTAFLCTEVRQQLGALENTDTRSQYTWSDTIAGTGTTVGTFGSFATTQPTITITPYTDMWAQPDAADLEGVANQRIPPGVNFQTKTRHQIFPLGLTGTDNNFLSTLTGNAVRAMLLICRDGTGARQDALTEPITWTLDNRNLGNLSPDQVFRWADDFLASYSQTARATGVYPFLRFYDPGDLKGQGWLYTANSTAVNWESVSQTVATVGTCELVQEEVYAVGAVDPTLIDI